jgi:hypothetical protein
MMFNLVEPRRQSAKALFHGVAAAPHQQKTVHTVANIHLIEMAVCFKLLVGHLANLNGEVIGDAFGCKWIAPALGGR